jgi:carboxyl-terminal processing protease
MNNIIRIYCCLFFSLTAQEIDREILHQSLDEALDIIEKNYPGQIDQNKILKEMLSSVVKAVDKNAAYLDQNQYTNMQNLFKGHSKGLGITLEKSIHGFKVMEIFNGSNAAQEGLLIGDIMLQVDDVNLKTISIEEFIKLITDNRPYKFKIKRKGKLITKIISPKEYKFSSLNLKFIKNVAYIKVGFIQEHAHDEMLEIINEIKKYPKVSGIILDIRNTPGGSLQAAGNIAALFLDGDVVVEIKTKTENGKIISSGPDLLKNIPIVVLQNRNTCSAAEVISASLKASKRAKIAGENSAGAATGKVFEPLKCSNGAIIITNAFLYNKDEKIISIDGISPDIVLKAIKESNSSEYDSQIVQLLSFLSKK